MLTSPLVRCMTTTPLLIGDRLLRCLLCWDDRKQSTGHSASLCLEKEPNESVFERPLLDDTKTGKKMETPLF